jgi:hypothetical protein
LIGGIRFVLEKVAAAAEQELYDEGRLREELLAAQMRVVLSRMRAIREARGGETATGVVGERGEFRVTGVEATFGGDEDEST